MDRELREPVVGEAQAVKEQEAPDEHATNGSTMQKESEKPQQLVDEQNGDANTGESHPVEDSLPESEEQQADPATSKSEEPKAEESQPKPGQPVEPPQQSKASEKHARHDSGDGELVRGQGGEDDVMY